MKSTRQINSQVRPVGAVTPEMAKARREAKLKTESSRTESERQMVELQAELRQIEIDLKVREAKRRANASVQFGRTFNQAMKMIYGAE